MQPFKPLEVFAVNERLDVNVIDLDHGDKFLVIDNFYCDPVTVRKLCLRAPVPIWKNTIDGLNSKEYWDCRHQWRFLDEPPFCKVLTSIIEEYYGVKVSRGSSGNSFVTNVFKWNTKQPENSVGNRAHFDSITMIAAIIYLNLPEEVHGGTAIYRHKEIGKCRGFSEDFDRFNENPKKYLHLVEDGKCYYDPNWQEYWILERVLEMKHNRVVIYPGYFFHGAYHVNNAFRDYPRITQACFLDCDNVPNESAFYKKCP